MGFGAAVQSCLSRYVDFQGRSRRSEYWWFVVFSILVAIAAGVVDAIVDPHSRTIGALSSLALFVPSIAVAVRRLHDTDRSGLWLLLLFVPIIGWIVLIYWYCLKGTPGSNQFGADPTA